MRGTRLWIVAASCTLIAFVTRWPFRSHALLSWDSANYALAINRIDIAAHRPHPPGYLGYVFAARALNTVVHDANTALVLWNILATALSAIVLALFAWESAESDRRAIATLAAVTLVLTSPAVWFYGEVAELYPSELLLSLLVGYSAWRAARGEDRAMYWCVAALALAAFFKVVTAILLLPLAVYAWSQASSTCRRRSASLFAVLLVVGGGGLLAVQPGLPTLVSRQFLSSQWLFRGEINNPWLMLNRNIRDTFTGAIVALGVVNVGALIFWALADRRRPSGISSALVLAWIVPGFVVFVFIQIAKPGYLLPLLPPVALVVAGLYARWRRGIAMTLIAFQAIVNTAHFMFMTPFSSAMLGGNARYAHKTLLQRAASDLQGVTFPTALTIARSDERMQALLSLLRARCPEGEAIIVADEEWRRVMWYLPGAIAVHAVDGRADFIGRQTDASPVPAEGLELHTRCPVVWLVPEDESGGATRSSGSATPVPHLGWITPPGTVRVTRAAVTSVDTPDVR